MHDCLRVQDILHGICAELRDLEPATRPATVAALARTCKGFYEPAVRVLWREIPGLSPIASLFPEEKVDIGKKGVICIKTEDVSFAVLRLLFYGPYVRKIFYDPLKRLHHQTLAFLNRSAELPKPLFPNATFVLLPCMADRFLESVFYPSLVLSPAIRSVTIFTGEVKGNRYGDEDDEDPNPERWQAVLDSLDDVSPSLHTFKVDQSFISSLHDGTLPAVPNFDNLHERLSANLTTMVVTGVSLSPKAIWSISELEGLAALTLTLDHRAYDFPPSTLLSFPALIKLHLLADGEDNEDICDPFIRFLYAPRLLDLQIDYNLQYETYDVPLQRLFLALGVPSVAPKISSIKIGKFNRNAHWSGDFNYSVPGAHLLPLANKNITKFEVSPCATREAEISDKELLRLFSAWPNLETLTLDKVQDNDGDGFDGPMGEGPILTLAGVSTAIRQCPLLKNLTLRCDARQIPPLDDESPHLSLVSWDVCTSLIKSGAAFAEWAKRTCPNLAVIHSFTELRDSMEGMYFDESTKRTSSENVDVIMLSRWDNVSRILSKRP